MCVQDLLGGHCTLLECLVPPLGNFEPLESLVLISPHVCQVSFSFNPSLGRRGSGVSGWMMS